MKDKILRVLFPSEIDEFVSRRGINKVAVRNFLSSIEFSETPDAAIINLKFYSKTHNLNRATIKAIEDGINRAVKRPIKL